MACQYISNWQRSGTVSGCTQPHFPVAMLATQTAKGSEELAK